jgi:hypothetical protein
LLNTIRAAPLDGFKTLSGQRLLALADHIRDCKPGTSAAAQTKIALAEELEAFASAPDNPKKKPPASVPIVDRWEDLTLYRMDVDKMLSYRVREAGKIRSVHCDGIDGGLSKGASRFLLAILNGVPVETITDYNAGSRSTILNELRKKLSAHFGPTEKPFRGNGKSPRFKICASAQVLTGPDRDPLNYDD